MGSYLYIYRHEKYGRFTAFGCEAFFGGSEGMCGSWDHCGVNYENGAAMDLSGSYWDRRDRATDLAYSWQVSDSLLVPASSVCNPTASCGGPGEFACDAIDRRLRGLQVQEVNPGCSRTCADIPIQVFEDQCNKGKSSVICI